MRTKLGTVAAVIAVLGVGAFAACGGDDGGPPTAQVAVRFAAGATAASASRGGLAFHVSGAAGPNELVITGTNGTLRISDIRVIVDEFKLKRTDVGTTVDCDVEPEPPGCADFEARFLFVDVPVSGEAPVTVTTGALPAGSYKELRFEVEDLETDASNPEDAADAALASALLATIRGGTFTDWPNKASMVVVGSFTPTGGTARSFRAYFEAEIEVRLPFATPFQVTEGTAESFRIELSPQVWFKLADGTVTDLSLSNCTPTACPLIRFELKIKDGFELKSET